MKAVYGPHYTKRTAKRNEIELVYMYHIKGCLIKKKIEYTKPWTGVNPPSQQTIISTATATYTQHAFLSKTDYATTGGEALWTLPNVFI